MSLRNRVSGRARRGASRRGDFCAFRGGRRLPTSPHSSVSRLRSLVNRSKLRVMTYVPNRAPHAMPDLAGKFPQQPTIPSGHEPSASPRHSGRPGLQTTTHRSSPVPGPSPSPWSKRTPPEHSTDGRPASSSPPFPAVRTEESPGPPLTTPGRVVPHSVSSAAGGSGGAWVGATGATPRTVPTLDFI